MSQVCACGRVDKADRLTNKPMHAGESARWADKLTKGERPTRASMCAKTTGHV